MAVQAASSISFVKPAEFGKVNGNGENVKSLSINQQTEASSMQKYVMDNFVNNGDFLKDVKTSTDETPTAGFKKEYTTNKGTVIEERYDPDAGLSYSIELDGKTQYDEAGRNISTNPKSSPFYGVYSKFHNDSSLSSPNQEFGDGLFTLYKVQYGEPTELDKSTIQNVDPPKFSATRKIDKELGERILEGERGNI